MWALNQKSVRYVFGFGKKKKKIGYQHLTFCVWHKLLFLAFLFLVSSQSIGKTDFASHTRHATEVTKGSTSIMRDNIWPWILEQRRESIPWCSKIQKQDLRIPSIFIPIPHDDQDEWSLN